MGKQLSITLPNRLADELEQRVAAGAYADRSEAVSDGLRPVRRPWTLGCAVKRRWLTTS